MAGGILMALIGSLVIGQVTRGQALQRLGIIQPTSGGSLLGKLFGGIPGAIGAGIGTEIGKTGFP